MLAAPTFQRIALGALVACGAACDASGGSLLHSSAPSEVTSELRYAIGGGAPERETTVASARVQECRAGQVSLSIGAGGPGERGRPKIASLYLKPIEPIAPGQYPLAWDGARWQSAWTLDGTLSPDPSRSLAPFAMERGTIAGQVTITRSEVSDDGVRTIAGTLHARLDGDPDHSLELDASFSVSYRLSEGCP